MIELADAASEEVEGRGHLDDRALDSDPWHVDAGARDPADQLTAWVRLVEGLDSIGSWRR